MLRVYEFDRYNGTVWQVDMLLSNGSFVAHPRVTNPTDNDLRGYWWTCVAVDAKPSTRIYAPATHVAETSRDPMRNAPWPHFAEAIENASFAGYDNKWMTDNSYLGNHQIGDMFLRIPDTVYTPYIGHSQEGEDGFTYIHGHSLNGTKFYTWGQSGPGRFMQDFLAGGGKRQGDYTELQVGPAPTQMQNFPVPRNSIREWTEWFKGFFADEKVVRGEDYDAALAHIDKWIASEDGMTHAMTADLDAFFTAHATVAPNEVLIAGQPWGALEELLLGKPLAAGLTFTLPKEGDATYAEALPWIELLKEGTFTSSALVLPISYQTTDRWLAKLEASAAKGMTWLHALHLGIAYTERGNIEGPRLHYLQSIAMKANPIAYRNLAVLCSTPEDAWPYWQQAWANLHSEWTKDPAYERLSLNLITEISFFLQQEGWYADAQTFITDVLTHGYLHGQTVDAFTTLQIKLYLNNKEYEAAQAILGKECFPTYAKARSDLMAMWNTATEGIAQQKKGVVPLTNVEKHQARVSNRIPDNIGCQYASEYCTNYW